MIKFLRGLGRATLGVLVLTASAAAQGVSNQPASNPVCVRLEGQLATVDRSAADPARIDQIHRAEDAVARQQADLDRTIAQAQRDGCEGHGFFSLFAGLSPKCGPITSKIQEMRGDLDRTMSDLERLKRGNTDQDGPRRALIVQLAQNNCGAQYTAAVSSSGPAGFFDALFGNGTIVNPGGDGAPSGTYQTVCVRTCDGYYFPISYSTVPSRFADDQAACQRQCPATEASLFTFHNPGEVIDQAVSISGQRYTALPNAFRYRKEVVQSCSCRRPGQTWADALKGADDSSTLQAGDVVVSDPKVKASPASTPARGGTAQPNATAAPTAGTASTTGTDPKTRAIRTVGPPFMSSR